MSAPAVSATDLAHRFLAETAAMEAEDRKCQRAALARDKQFAVLQDAKAALAGLVSEKDPRRVLMAEKGLCVVVRYAPGHHLHASIDVAKLDMGAVA